MPYLISIDCIATFNHGYDNNDTIPVLIIDQGIFHRLNYLRFKSYCCDKYCICRNVLPRLINRMPNLRSLITSDDAFLRVNHPLPPITRLDWSEWDFKAFDILIKHVPCLSMLALGDIRPYIEQLSNIIDPDCSNDQISYRKMIQESLIPTQNMNNRLRRLRLNLECEGVRFYLEN